MIRFEIDKGFSTDKQIEAIILAMKSIFEFFYKIFENKKHEGININVGFPTNKFGGSYYDGKNEILLPEWLTKQKPVSQHSLPDWLQNTESDDINKTKHLENNLKNFDPNEIILSKSIQDDIDFLVKQYQNREHFEKFSASLPRGIILY